MEHELSLSEKPLGENVKPYFGIISEWDRVLLLPAEEDGSWDEDSPPLESGFYGNPVRRFNGRIIEPRKSPLDPIAPDILEFIKTRVPQIDMVDGTPVFEHTKVPIKRMFDLLLAGKPLEEFLRDYPSVPRVTAVAVLGNEATLFYESISVAIDAVTLAPTSTSS